MAEHDLVKRWLSLRDDQITEDLIQELLSPIQDDLWVTAACTDRILDDVDAQRALIDLGIQRTDSAIICAREILSTSQADTDSSKASQKALVEYFAGHVTDAHLCRIRSELLSRRDRLRTFDEVKDNAKPTLLESSESDSGTSEEGWEDDPWADGDAEAGPSSRPMKPSAPPIPLSVFLTEELSILCLALASQAQFPSLKALINRYPADVFPLRFEIISRIPLFIDPSNYRDLLPALNSETRKESIPKGAPWRTDLDLSETVDVRHALSQVDDSDEASLKSLDNEQAFNLQPEPLSVEELLSWYRRRVETIIASTCMVDIALSLVQHGVSQGVIGLDELGEDLTLISRLVYDAPGSTVSTSETITLSEWTSLEPRDIVRRYLTRSSPDTIVSDVRRLVMPYLFVLESRCERAGTPDPELVKRHLYDYVLTASLNMVVPIFEASKPTQPTSQRLISNDDDLARLALACLYGSDSLTDWTSMSRIFECLPAWNFAAEEDEADTTVASLSAFLVPSTARPQTSPSDLLMFFKPLPSRSLSRALDILDVHLESGEILSRWGVPVPLRWFLQSAHDEAQQRACAMKMARQTDAPVGDLDSEDIWLSLLEDMLKIARPEESKTDTNSAFGTLSGDAIRQIFFRGLLSTSRFAIAKQIIKPRHGERLLDAETIEKLCLDCSREFYDNASSGNYNFGDMKLAYDCLSVAPQTYIIQKEREFIEATSRISSFNVTSRPGVPILPIEIRLTKDKLSLVSRVLSSNESAYKHVEVLLELVRKLGFRDDPLAEVKTLAMVADTALQAEDFTRAFEASERMINAVLRLRQNAPLGADSEQVREAVEVCWVACYQLGRQPEAKDVERKISLLGRALELCPPDKIVDILTSWRKLEAEEIERRKEKTTLRQSQNGGDKKNTDRMRGRTSTSTLSARLQNSLHMPSPTLPSASALASNTFSRVAAAFPFAIHGRSSEERSRSREASPDMQSQARHALRKGVGWLIGAEDDEL
ncbi:Sec39-domain-containing protein [Fomitiporia mediterranea MF3/22]|uniref:Sec39-domain-containing protein n=1 Tax=Fomitiporia mediterranea (strain MF3/22) TaxID=694068 RepID=UPI00044094B2|nr:Sec39-domain-containing protein [Fomitiporia mediterranea MF3/22]EJD04059.1 Sec39-domain-containing protein [Fomitiporia mediterranea MF3/22]